jgi:DNA-binding response OmpR family regulator
VRAQVAVVSGDRMRAHRLRAVLLRGHFTAHVLEPAAALATAQAGRVPEVFVFDLADPTCDGLALCAELRALHVAASILMLHPHGSLDDLLDGYEAGADGYLTGEVDHTELFQRLDALTGPQALRA